jgi:DNA-directed RNA polymerase specialized sigma24 family protein
LDEVVKNCTITASRNPPTFECEGAFRSWLVRVLIDEALAIVRQRKSDVTNIGTGQLAEAQPNGFDQRCNHESEPSGAGRPMRYANIGEGENAD